jgi:hypothetical protein
MTSDIRQFLSSHLRDVLDDLPYGVAGLSADDLYVETGADEEADCLRPWFDERLAGFVTSGFLRLDGGLYALADKSDD